MAEASAAACSAAGGCCGDLVQIRVRTSTPAGAPLKFPAMQKVLVVDDDPHIRDVVCFALRRAGYQPLPAANGLAALDARRRARCRHW